MMKNLVILLLICLCADVLIAQNVKIIKCNTPTVTVGGKRLVVGDVFDINDTIKWSSKEQVVIIKKDDGRMIRLAASSSENGKQDVVSLLLRKSYVHFSTRGDEMPEGLYYVEDSLFLPLDLEKGFRPQLKLICKSEDDDFLYRPSLSSDGKYAIIGKDIFENRSDSRIECKLIGISDNDFFEFSGLMILIPLENALDADVAK